MIKLGLIGCLLYCSTTVWAQVNWMNFEQLDSALTKAPKPTVVFLEAEWCAYCKKMQKEAFTDTAIQQLLNDKFYAVKLDIENPNPCVFDGKVFNGASNKGFHEMAYLFAEEGEVPVTPTLAILDMEFKFLTIKRNYLSRKELLNLLRKAH